MAVATAETVKSTKMDRTMEEDVADGGDEEDEDIEEEYDDGEEEEGDDSVTHGRRSGRGLTLMTLLKEKVLLPGVGNMTINYLGNKFKGDLLSDGRIRSQETGKVFGTPSAWAIYCKQIVNPNKKSGCGWASVKYRGKKLDEYKNNWNRQKRMEFERGAEDECPGEEDGGSCSESDGGSPHDHEILEFDMLNTRHDPPYASNPLVELTSFSSLGRLQPFTVAASSSAMAVLDLHVHLTKGEAIGFLAGQWDVNNHNLIVSHAFPLCYDMCESSAGGCSYGSGSSSSRAAGHAAETAILRQMSSLKLALVGWYHSHPHSSPVPSLRDVDCQLDYEIKMKGTNDASYTPCIGFIVSPFKDQAHRRDMSMDVNMRTKGSVTDAAPELAVNTSSSNNNNNNNNTAAVNGSMKVNTAATVTTSLSSSVVEASPVANTVSITPVADATVSVSGVPMIPSTAVSATVTGVTPMNCFWVMPPPEHRPHEYPRPMSIIYNVVQDAFVPKEALIHMRECVKHYSKAEDAINLHDTYKSSMTYWDKLKVAVKARVPKDHFPLLIEYLHKILRIKFPLPELPPSSPTPLRDGNKDEKPLSDMLTESSSRTGSPVTTHSILLHKTKDISADISIRGSSSSRVHLSDNRARPYPDPAKLHPLLVDRSDTRTIQPLLLDRTASGGITHPFLNDGSNEKSETNTDQSDRSRSHTPRESSSPGVPLPATQNPPEYPFPLLRGMMAEQVSSLQKQQEQRYEEELVLEKEKQQYKTSQERLAPSQPLTEKDLLLQINEKFLHQQRQLALEQQLKTKQSSDGKVTSIFPQLGASPCSQNEENLPSYGMSNQLPSQYLSHIKEGETNRGSPPPYSSVAAKQAKELTVFQSPHAVKVTDSYKKIASNNESGRLSSHDTSSVTLTSTRNFSPLNLLTSVSLSECNSILPSSLTITPTSAAGHSFVSLPSNITNAPATLSITSVSRDSPSNFVGLQNNDGNSLTNSCQSNTSSSLTLSVQHPTNLNSSFYPNPSSNVSSSPLSSGHTPNLSPSPISFNPPRTNSPSLSNATSVEVSPRHTEWAQNALAGMSRPPIISVKSQAALSQQPYSPSASTAGTTSPAIVTAVPTDISTLNTAAALSALTGNADVTRVTATNPVISQTTLTEAITSGAAADHWMQASFAGLAQFAGYGGNQYNKASTQQYLEQQQQQQQQQQYQQYRNQHSLLPTTEHQLLQQHQEQRKQ